MRATNLADLYDLPVLDWARIEARLNEGLRQAPGAGGPDRHTCWLATINPDDTGAALTAEFSAPSAGAPPWHVYRITVRAATALSTVEPGGATSWRF
jgi:hypothetical protein